MRAHRQTARSVLTRSKKVVTSVFSHIKKQSHVRLAQLDTTLSKNKYYRSYANFIYKFSNTQLFKRVGVVVLVMAFMFAYLVRPVSAIQTWNQTDWSGGVGTSTSNQYSSATNIDDSTSGEITLSKSSNLFSNPTFDTNTTGWNGSNIAHETSTKYSGTGSLKSTPAAASSYPFNATTTSAISSSNAQRSATADFNNDGLDDIVISGGSACQIYVYLSDGNGSWQSPQTYATSCTAAAYDVTTGDFNNDGSADIVVSYLNSTTFSTFTNNGSGTNFTHTSITGPIVSRPCSVASADFDQNGYADIVFGCYVATSFYVYLNDGSGGFPTKNSYSMGSTSAGTTPSTVFTLDMNGDTYQDIAIVRFNTCSVIYLINNGTGVFGTYTEKSAASCGVSGNNSAYAATKVDLNGDSYDDIAFSFRTSGGGLTDGYYLATMLGNASANPTTINVYSAITYTNYIDARMVSGDFNMDGHEDIIVTAPNADQYSLYLNNGDGTLASHVDYAQGTYPTDVDAGDYNGDGKPDISFTTRTSQVLAAALNNTNGDAITQQVNVGDTAEYHLEGYVYTTGSAVTASDATLYAQNASLATTYTAVGSGWYRLSATITGVAEKTNYGIQVNPGVTAYIDDFAMYKYSSPGTLTSSIFDLGFGGKWNSLTYSATGSGVVVKVRTSNNSDMSGATSFASCPSLSSDNTAGSLTGQTCMTDNDRYVQYQITLTVTAGIAPVFDDITISYSAWDNTAPTTNGSTILMYKSNGGDSVNANDWTNADTPYFTWTAGQDNAGGSGIKGYCLYLGTTSSGDPQTTQGILGSNSPVDTPTCPFAVASNDVDLSSAGYLASALSTDDNPYYLNIKAIDNADNIFDGSSEQFQFRFDNTAPSNPAFIAAPSTFSSSKQATLSWETSGNDAASDSNSGVAGLQYRIGSGGTWYGDIHTGDQNASDLLANDGGYTTQDPPDYDNLVDGNNVVYFRTWDNAGNISLATVTTVLKI